MTVTYTDAAKVARFLGVDDFVTGNDPSGRQTVPSLEEVEAFINIAEDKIDADTRKAWRAVAVTDEFHDLPLGQWRRAHRFLRREYVINAKRRPLQTFVSGTDKIEIHNGTEFVDLISSSDFTEGREEDYFFDLARGKIFIRGQRPRYRKAGIKLTYRHGEATVPGDIENAATILVGIKLIEGSRWSNLFPDDTAKIDDATMIVNWKADYEDIVVRHLQHIAPGA